MANPRQRRKQRSNHSAVRHSNHAKRKLKKMPALRAPKVLRDAWDSKLTVKQNYAALGLAASLNPRAKGGSENAPPLAGPAESQDPGRSSPIHSIDKVSKGFGRIVRDATGNVVDIELGEEKAEPVTKEGDAIVRGQQIQTWSGQGTRHSESTDLVKNLETLASRVIKKPRLASSGEKSWLKEVVAKYGVNYEAAARDRKINPWQRTAGEIRRSVVKAGGIESLS